MRVILLTCGAVVALVILGQSRAQVVATPIEITLTPMVSHLAAGETKTMTATLQPDSPGGVKWTTSGGTISGDGETVRYTAPKTPGTYFVRVRSIDQPRRSGLSEFVVDAPTPAQKPTAAQGCAPAATLGKQFCMVPITNAKYTELKLLGWTNAGQYFVQARERSSSDTVLLLIRDTVWTEVDRLAGGNFTQLGSRYGNGAGLLTGAHPVFYYTTNTSGSFVRYDDGKKIKVFTEGDVGPEAYKVEPKGDLYLGTGGANLTVTYISRQGQSTTVDQSQFCTDPDRKNGSIEVGQGNSLGALVVCRFNDSGTVGDLYLIYGETSTRVYHRDADNDESPHVDPSRYFISQSGKFIPLDSLPSEFDHGTQYLTDINSRGEFFGLATELNPNGYLISDGEIGAYALSSVYKVPLVDGTTDYITNGLLGFVDDDTIMGGVYGDVLTILKRLKRN